MASIAHAIMVAHYPQLAHEHSWDGLSYNVQDSQGARGTVTFEGSYCVAAFRCDDIQPRSLHALELFQGAPEHVIQLAHTETLQYLLGEVNGQTIPIITAAFWGERNRLFSADQLDELLANGASILERQLMEEDESIAAWIEYWDMSREQAELMVSIYRQKLNGPFGRIVLTKEEVATIGAEDQDGLAESRTSFREIGVELP